MAPIQLYIWDDRFLYATPGMSSGSNSRHTATILIATRDRPLTLETDDGQQGEFRAVLVAPHVSRKLVAPDCDLLSLNLDPISYEYHVLAELFRGRPLVPLAIEDFTPLQPQFRQLFAGELSCSTAFRLAAGVVSTISNYRPSNILVDLRVFHVAQRIKSELPDTVPVSELAKHVGLSPGRLTHLFTQQCGMSIRSYTLWAKMRRAAVLLGEKWPLTDVAHRVGFSDSAHLSRTFQQFFGLPPSFLGDSRYVQVHACET